jgi:hypothetical protein
MGERCKACNPFGFVWSRVKGGYVPCPLCTEKPMVMEGGETGEDDCGDQPWITLVAYFGNGQIEPLTCPAPTPTAGRLQACPGRSPGSPPT